MIYLKSGCAITELTVNPTNWQTKKASTKKNWYISYTFYNADSLLQTTGRRGKLQIVKGMNHIKDLQQRQVATQMFLDKLEDALHNRGFNPITGEIDKEQTNAVNKLSMLIPALQHALQHVDVVASTKADLKSIVKNITAAVVPCNLQYTLISDTTRAHVKQLIEHVGKVNPRAATPARYNKYRTYLQILFTFLINENCMEHNPCDKLPKKKQIKTIRETLSDAQRVLVDEALKSYPTFRNFMHIFYHSGARVIELLAVQAKDVNLAKGEFKAIVRKGSQYKEHLYNIKDVALPLWQAQLIKAQPNDFIFSNNLTPGVHQIRRDQITRRWNEHVKKKLGITADFYSLKHSHADDVAAYAGIEQAQKFIGHTSQSTTEIYATNNARRKNDALKKLPNTFIPE